MVVLYFYGISYWNFSYVDSYILTEELNKMIWSTFLFWFVRVLAVLAVIVIYAFIALLLLY